MLGNLKKVCASVSVIGAILLSGCQSTRNQTIGSPMLFAVDKSGFVRSRDNYLARPAITKADTLTISMNTPFIKHLKDRFEMLGNHVLIYTEVYDSPDVSDPYRTVVLNQRDQPANALTGVADRVIYGPLKYKGFPIRIRMFIIELDKKDNETIKNLLEAAGSAVESAKPDLAPVVSTGIQLAKIFLSFNRDDYELSYDLTLHPAKEDPRVTTDALDDTDLGVPSDDKRANKYSRLGAYDNAQLRAGSFVIVKTETRARGRDSEDPEPEEYFPASFFTYPDGTHRVVSVDGKYMWIDTLNESDPINATEWTPAETELYKEKTYVLLSVSTGDAVGDEAKMRDIAGKEWGKVENLLQQDSADLVSAGFKELGAGFAASAREAAIVKAANTKAKNDSNFRNTNEFVMMYIDELVGTDAKANAIIADPKLGGTYASKLNRKLIEIIEDTVKGFPLSPVLHADDYATVQQVKTDAAKKLAPSGQNDGLFAWK